jgi:hypothetical protein
MEAQQLGTSEAGSGAASHPTDQRVAGERERLREPVAPAAPAASAPVPQQPDRPAVDQRADPIAEAPQLRWYVLPPGSTSQYGPASGGELLAWIQQGRVPPDSFVWREDWTEWKVAGRVLPQLGAMGGPLLAIHTAAALPMAPGHLPTAAGPLPVAAAAQPMAPAGSPVPGGSSMPQVTAALPQAVPVGPHVPHVPHVGSPPAGTAPQIAFPHMAGVGQAALAVPAATVPLAMPGVPAAAESVPPVSTASRYAASLAATRRRSKTASLVAIVVLVLAIAALAPLVYKVVFYP